MNFADDNLLYDGLTELEQLESTLFCGLKKVLDLFDFNPMVPNPEKFQVLLIPPTKGKSVISLNIQINDRIIQEDRNSKTSRIRIRIYSQLNYCNLLWTFYPKYENSKIVDIQRRIIKYIIKKNRRRSY